ncbi:septum formation family protein [Actinomadura sp. HBU206391]|uniref:septum formation family protein n=1 Tax=Actinomadura sp. HBU206391 TaxID=2731692 RepID=UPI00164F00EE|nr:septum formation family protein [Actinomadura sp. HBU206391]MBC6463701.1 septum formation family protein [Actinomadura sp. HBU206391]
MPSPVNQEPRTDGFALTSFILAAFALIPVSLGFALVGYRRIAAGRRSGRGLLVAALVLNCAWLLVMATGVVLLVTEVRQGQRAYEAVRGLAVGDCFDARTGSGTDFEDVRRQACESPHDFEVTVKFDLAAGAWPGDEKVAGQANVACAAHTRKVPSTDGNANEVVAQGIVPSGGAWRKGQRTVTCLAQREGGGKLVGSLKAAPTPLDLSVGQCFDGFNRSEQSFEGTATVRPCDGPHDAEVANRRELPAGAWPGQAAVETQARALCRDRGDVAERGSDGETQRVVWLAPHEGAWAGGRRVALCLVVEKDLGRLTAPYKRR